MVATSQKDDLPASRAELLTELDGALTEAMAVRDALDECGALHAVVTATLDSGRQVTLAVPVADLVTLARRRVAVLYAHADALARTPAAMAAAPGA